MFQLLSLCFVVLLNASALADFIVVTDFTAATPTVTPINNLESAKYSASLSSVSSSYILSWASAQPLVSLNAYTSALTELQKFVASATKSYSIPGDVTGTAAVVTFTTKPEWYDELPMNVRRNNDINVSLLKGIQERIVSGEASSSASTGAATNAGNGPSIATATPTPTSGAADAAKVGAGLVGVFAAGVVLL